MLKLIEDHDAAFLARRGLADALAAVRHGRHHRQSDGRDGYGCDTGSGDISDLDRKITRLVLELGATMTGAGFLTGAILFGLAALMPLPPESLGRDLRNGVGMAVAIVLGLRASRWMGRRWFGD